MKPDRTGLALAGVAAVGWAFAGIWVRLLPAVPVPTLVAARLGLSLVALAPILVTQRARLGVATPAAWGLAALMAGYYVVALTSFRFAPVAEATLFINASPLFAVGWALVRGEAVSRDEKAGTALALAGVALILLPEMRASADSLRLVGDTLALSAGAAMAVYAVAFRRLGATGPTPLLVTALTFGLGAAALALIGGVQGRAAAVGLETPASWAALGGLALVSTAIPTLAFSEASQRLPSVLVTATRLLTPVVAAVAAWQVLSEVPSVWLVPGGALVLGGLALTVRA